MIDDAEMTKLLREAKTIAVVGLTNNSMRPSFGVSRFLQRQGYRIIPVNPKEQGKEVLGEKAYSTLSEVPDSIDIVDVFRRSEHIPPVVDDALKKGTRCIWMQEGIAHEDAAKKAEAAGVTVVMNRCILKEIARLLA